MVFVFGSNEAGIHGSGAAKYALDKEGAVFGGSFGLQGNSFAIPTKSVCGQCVGDTLPLEAIKKYVDGFLFFAECSPESKFKVTQVGCGLAGLKASDMAPMFVNAPDNCYFDTAWAEYLPGKNFWGTFE